MQINPGDARGTTSIGRPSLTRLQIVCVATVIWAATSVLQAQTSTADGVAAFVRGDYRRAAEILKPLAERWPQAGDPVAQFFMAMMYEAGHGVPADAVRACALYGLGAFDGPFRSQSFSLFQRAEQSLDTDQFDECVFVQGIGFDHGFQPATFALEPTDSIAIDMRGTTITYRGTPKRLDAIVPAASGVIFLPIEHTRLLTGPAWSTARHFIEVMAWIPLQPHTWGLAWSLFEVVRDQLIAVASDELTRVSAPRPPADSSFDVRSLVQLGVNDSGVPEWRILTGPDARSEGIPSEAEREEVAALERARLTAAEQIDWTRALDAGRTPAMTYSDADGCGDLHVYGWSRDRGEAITISVNEELVPLDARGAVQLVLPQPGVDIEVQVYDRPYRSLPFCTDIYDAELRRETWRATAGTVTIEVTPRGVRARHADSRRATIRITDAELTNAAGTRIRQKQPVTLTAVVGTPQGLATTPRNRGLVASDLRPDRGNSAVRTN